MGRAVAASAAMAADALLPAAFCRPADPRPKPALSDLRLAIDLGDRIGSLDWFRGVATLGALLATVAHFAPGFRMPPMPAAPAMQRAQPIAPVRSVARPRIAPAPVVAPEPATIDLVLTQDAGEGFIHLLERSGAAHGDAERAASLIRRSVDPFGIAPDTRIALTLGPRPAAEAARPIAAMAFRARFDLSLALRRADGRLVLDRHPIAVDTTPLHVVGLVGHGLYAAQRAAGVPFAIAAEFQQAIAPHVDPGAIGASDAYDLVYEHQRAATGEERTGRLLYAGITYGGRPLRLVRWTLDGQEQWFDVAGIATRHDGFTVPVSGAQISSGFGLRFHPILGFSRMHQGVDLAAPEGTPIVAATDGVVRFAGWHGGHGNFVQIDHKAGMGTGYGHMSSFVVHPGDRVRQGQLIGYVGSTGLSTGPHCHFEVYRDGVAIDPATARFESVRQIAGPALKRFRATIARLTALPVADAPLSTKD